VLQEPAASFLPWNPRIEPNSAIYLLLAGLIRFDRRRADRQQPFLSLYGLVWIGAAYAVSRSETSGRSADAAVAADRLRHLHPLGVYNFALGVPLFLLFCGLLAQRARTRRRDGVRSRQLRS